MQIIAVIVTFNRLPLLKQAVRAVLGQSRAPDQVLIVDNASTDGSRAWLAALEHQFTRVRVIRLAQNSGGAGGFYAGFKKAYEMGADWIWSMDDDSLPAPDALEKLAGCLTAADREALAGIGFLASQVTWTNGQPHVMNVPGPAMDWAAHPPGCPGAVKIEYSSFVSALFSRKALECAGYPIRQFFIYGDDVEFTRRITTAGFGAYYIPGSRVVHQTGQNAGITYDWLTDPANCARFRCRAVRNLVMIHKTRPFGRMRELGRILYIAWRSMRRKADPMDTIRLIRAGLTGYVTDHRKWIEIPCKLDT